MKKKISLILLLTIITSISACQEEEPTNVWIDNNCSDEEIGLSMVAIHKLNAALENKTLNLKGVVNPGPHYPTDGKTMIICKYDIPDDEDRLGTWTGYDTLMFIPNIKKENTDYDLAFLNAVMHELGHLACGSHSSTDEHVEDPNSIMNWRITLPPVTEYSDIDIQMFEEQCGL